MCVCVCSIMYTHHVSCSIIITHIDCLSLIWYIFTVYSMNTNWRGNSKVLGGCLLL